MATPLSAAYIPVRSAFAANRAWPDLAGPAALAASVLVAAVFAWIAASARKFRREAWAWRDQMRQLHEFTRRALEMNLHVEPGPRLAEMVREIFAVDGVVIFDADLHQTYQAGSWGETPAPDPQEMARNVYYFETSDDDPATGLARRVLRLGSVPIGSLVLRAGASPLTNDAIASLIATTFDRYRAFASE